MFVLDTNVLSEIMKSSPEPQVAHWVARQPRHRVSTTVVSKAEILAGIAMMPTGRRQRDLGNLARNLFETYLSDCVLPFEDVATAEFARISTARRRAGRTIIAAISLSRDATVVTRKVRDFELAGLPIIDPWNLT